MDVIRKLTAAFDWLRIPFTYGETWRQKSYCKDRKSRGLNENDKGIVKSRSYNGLISSCQLFIIMEVVFGVQLLSYFVSESVSVSGMQLRINLMVYMTAGMVIILTIYCKRQRFISIFESSDSRKVKGGLEHDNVILAGIMMFYVLGTVYDLLHIISSFSCHEAWLICGSSYFVAKDMVHIVYHITRVIFLTGQTLFCMVFIRARFIDQSMTRHSLMFLQAVNISCWAYETVRASDSEIHGSAEFITRRVKLFMKSCLSNASSHSFDLMSCLSNNDTMYYYSTRYSNSILRPFSIEYSLLIGECLMSWFFTCIARSTEKVDRRNTLRNIDSHLSSENNLNGRNTAILRSRQSRSGPRQGDQRHTATTFQPHAQPSEDSSSQVVPPPASQSSQFQFFTFLLLMISIIINLILAVLIFVPRILSTTLGSSIHFKSMRAIAPYYSCFYYIVMIFAIALGYHSTRYFRVLKNMPFGGLDYLLLLTSSGNLAFDLFRLIGIIRSNQKDVFTSHTDQVFYGGYVFLEVLETSFQVSFSLYAGRLRINNQPSSVKPVLFRAIILFLALCNLTTWIIQTFAVSVTSHTMMTKYLGLSGWIYVSSTLMPVFLFFRFNSFLVFVRIYRRLCMSVQ